MNEEDLIEYWRGEVKKIIESKAGYTFDPKIMAEVDRIMEQVKPIIAEYCAETASYCQDYRSKDIITVKRKYRAAIGNVISSIREDEPAKLAHLAIPESGEGKIETGSLDRTKTADI